MAGPQSGAAIARRVASSFVGSSRWLQLVAAAAFALGGADPVGFVSAGMAAPSCREAEPGPPLPWRQQRPVTEVCLENEALSRLSAARFPAGPSPFSETDVCRRHPTN